MLHMTDVRLEALGNQRLLFFALVLVLGTCILWTGVAVVKFDALFPPENRAWAVFPTLMAGVIITGNAITEVVHMIKLNERIAQFDDLGFALGIFGTFICAVFVRVAAIFVGTDLETFQVLADFDEYLDKYVGRNIYVTYQTTLYSHCCLDNIPVCDQYLSDEFNNTGVLGTTRIYCHPKLEFVASRYPDTLCTLVDERELCSGTQNLQDFNENFASFATDNLGLILQVWNITSIVLIIIIFILPCTIGSSCLF